jgi:DNA repair ATPase RecN
MSLNKEEQLKINSQLKERINEKQNVFSTENVNKTFFDDSFNNHNSYEDDYYSEESDRRVKSIEIDFKTLRDLFYKEQELNKLEERSRYQTLDISNLTIQKQELEEKIEELTEQQNQSEEAMELITKIVKFLNRNSFEYKTKNVNNTIELQKNITEIEILFRKTEKEYNDIIKDLTKIEHDDVRRYFNGTIIKKFHDILEVYNKRYDRIDTLNMGKNFLLIFSFLIMFYSVIYAYSIN